MNKLLFGDNLGWLQDKRVFPDESVDLVYLDPPFNSNADYNVLFREESGQASQAQFHAFTDSWNWADAADIYNRFMDTCPNIAVVEMLQAMRSFLKTSPMMAYLAMMTPRLVELHRVLKSTGSLYLHCDPTASHYLKLLLDAVFGARNYRNEITWKRVTSHSDAKRWSPITDTIFYYTKTEEFTWNPQSTSHDEEYVADRSRFDDRDGRGPYRLGDMTSPSPRPNMMYEWKGYKSPPKGWRFSKENHAEARRGRQDPIPHSQDKRPQLKRYLREMSGHLLGSLWTDINPINSQANERLGFPTQKPVALLERILSASSNPGDVVLDPFGGCGTTIHAAQKLQRTWIAIDITYLAINLIKRRLKDAFGDRVQYEEFGQPTDFESAKRLAELDKWQFQQWALSLVHARPLKEGSGKGADRGVDGLIYFYESKDQRERILVQVKGGAVQRSAVAALIGDVKNQKFAAGVLVTLEKPTKAMREEAADAGRYTSALWHTKDYPRIQIVTIEGLVSGQERLECPPPTTPSRKPSPR